MNVFLHLCISKDKLALAVTKNHWYICRWTHMVQSSLWCQIEGQPSSASANGKMERLNHFLPVIGLKRERV